MRATDNGIVHNDPDEVVFPAMTVREAAMLVFDQDWNSRRTVLHSVEGEQITLNFNIRFVIDTELARKILKEIESHE